MDISLFMLTFPIIPSIHPSICKYHNISLSAFVALYCLMAFQLSIWLKSLTSYSLLRALNLSCMFIRLTSVSLCFYRYIASDMRVNCKRAKKKCMLCLLSPFRNSGRHLLWDSEPRRGCENDGVCLSLPVSLPDWMCWCETDSVLGNRWLNMQISPTNVNKPAFGLF